MSKVIQAIREPYRSQLADLTSLAYTEHRETIFFRPAPRPSDFFLLVDAKLAEKIAQISKEALLKEREEGKTCRVEPRHWKTAFEAARQLVEEGGGLVNIYEESFETTLDFLMKQKLMTDEENNEWRKKISAVPRISDYQEIAKTTRDIAKALSLAVHYVDQNSLNWLCRAKNYLNGRKLSEAVDLPLFLENLNCVTTVAVFNDQEELLESIAVSKTIIKLALPDTTDYNLELTGKIAAFLKTATSITEVCLSGNWPYYEKCERLSEKMLPPISAFLQSNTHVTSLDISNTPVYNNGIRSLLQAICQNPNPILVQLNIERCGATEELLPDFLEVIRAKKGSILLGESTTISQEAEEEIEKAQGCTTSSSRGKKPLEEDCVLM